MRQLVFFLAPAVLLLLPGSPSQQGDSWFSQAQAADGGGPAAVEGDTGTAPLFAVDSADDTDDTDDTDVADSDTDPVDTDTDDSDSDDSDTDADTASDTDPVVVGQTAAELLGEEGGAACAQSSPRGWLAVLLAIGVMLRRRRVS